MKLTASLLSFLAAALAAGAAPDTPRKPSAPFLGPIPERLSYVKKLTYPEIKSPGNGDEAQDVAAQLRVLFPKITQVDCVITGDTIREICKLSNGSSRERWHWQGFRILVDSSRPGRIRAAPQNNQDPQELDEGTPTFGEAAWVADQYFTGTQSKEGHDCFVYRKGESTVWIDQQTGLPVLYQSPRVHIAYSYRKTPSTNLSPPEAYKAQVEANKRAWSGGPL